MTARRRQDRRDVGGTPDPYAGVRRFLGEASARPDFIARAFARVEAKAEDLDESYRWASLGAMLGDAIRQAEDVAGYAAVLAARVEADARDQLAARRARAMLTAACEHAAGADEMLAELRRLVERGAA